MLRLERGGGGRRLLRGARPWCGRGGLFRSLAPIPARVVQRRVPDTRHVVLEVVHEDLTVAGTWFRSLLIVAIPRRSNSGKNNSSTLGRANDFEFCEKISVYFLFCRAILLQRKLNIHLSEL